jgi:hypothetical protein
VPAALGWAPGVWGLVAGVLLGRSPFLVFLLPGVLLVQAAQKNPSRTDVG